MKTYILVCGIDEGAEEIKLIEADNDDEASCKSIEYINEQSDSNFTVEDFQSHMYKVDSIGYLPCDGDSERWYTLFKLKI